MAATQHLRNAKAVEALIRARQLVARMDCLDATAELDQNIRQERDRIEDRDAAMVLWQSTLASGVLPPEHIAGARMWVLARERAVGLAGEQTAASRAKLAHAMDAFAVAQAGEDVAQAMHRDAAHKVLRHNEERNACEIEDRVLRGVQR